jgi:hypothetical protein
MPSNYERISRQDLEEKLKRAVSLLVGLYTERAHFILELLQNAEDARATRVRFDLQADRLEVWHDGRLFNEDDVRGVCGVGEGTKIDSLTQIGKFGIGFKSVYAFTDRPEIHCGDEHFAIEKYIHPLSIGLVSIPPPWTTLFILPFNRTDVAPDVACAEIAQGLNKLDSGAMLFLRHIHEIEWSAPGGSAKRYIRQEVSQGPARRVSLTVDIQGLASPTGSWLVFDAPICTDDCDDHLRVEAAFKVEKGREDRIAPVAAATLSVFFATATRTGLGFTIQGPYRTTPARSEVPSSDHWNRDLVKRTATLVVSALGHLRDMNLLTADALSTMPVRASDFPDDGMFRPIFDSVADAIRTQSLIPTDSGDFVSAAYAKIARGSGIRELFPAGVPNGTAEGLVERMLWLSANITEVRTPELYKYLRDVLKIEEVTPEGIVRQLDQRFLQERPDDWLMRFYEFLASQEALWRKSRWQGDTPGPARSVPIIRIEKGTHVLPFKKDGSPAAYLKSPIENDKILLVRKTITARERSRQFLEKLGFGEFDMIAELRDFVLPLYRPPSSPVSREQNLQHLAWIGQVLKEAKNDERTRTFVSEVKDTPLIHASSAASTPETRFIKPGQAYFRTDDLVLYFDGNPNAWFVTEYPDDLRETLEELGVSDKERELAPTRKHFAGCATLASVTRDYVSYYRRGVLGFDPELDVDGLRHALACREVERSRYIWNRIALPRLQQVRGIVEEATRFDFRNLSSRSETSKMGDALINSAWLPFGDHFVKPAELTLEGLPDGFERNEMLGRQLGMKVDEIAVLLQRFDITAETLTIAKQIKADPDLYSRFRTLIDAKDAEPEFPSRPIPNPQRRAARVALEAQSATEKNYEHRSRSVRASEPAQDPTTWLRESYTNSAGQMICQICEKPMPFKKRNGQYYFEAVESLNTLPQEHHALYLALCPICAAKYKEFVKHDPPALEHLQIALASANEPVVSIQVGGDEASIRFVDSHFLDLQTILRESCGFSRKRSLISSEMNQ